MIFKRKDNYLEIKEGLEGQLYESIFHKKLRKNTLTYQIGNDIYKIKYSRFLDTLRGTVTLRDKLWRFKGDLAYWNIKYKRIR